MKKIYISGKITGLDFDDYFNNFSNTEEYLERLFPDSEIVNPIKIKPFLMVEKWLFYLIADIWQLLKCDCIYLQDNWIYSKGARIELFVALLFNKKVITN